MSPPLASLGRIADIDFIHELHERVHVSSVPPDHIRILSFPVEGMTCASCVGRVEKAAASLPGVRSAVANLASEKLTLTIEEGQTDLQAIKAAVDDAGYTLNLPAATGTTTAAPARDATLDALHSDLILSASSPLP